MCLVGMPLLARNESKLLQTLIMTIVAVSFGIFQSECTPYKMALDNTLRVCTEQHTVVVAAVAGALVMQQPAQSGGQRKRAHSHDAGNAAETWQNEASFVLYDSILITTFVVMVLVPLLVAIAAKAAIVKHAMQTELSTNKQSTERFDKLTCIFNCFAPVMELLGMF